MLSYLTTPLHEAQTKANPFIQSILFEEGAPLVTEAAGLLKTSTHQELGEKFICFLLSAPVQQAMLENIGCSRSKGILLNPLLSPKLLF